MKRFYKTATAVALDAGGFTVQLDGRAIKTPAKAALIVPNRATAELIAQDWNRQGDSVDAANMHYARFANSAIDRVAVHRDLVEGEVVAYGGSDLICYRAEHPESLVDKQQQTWDPYLAFAFEALGADLRVTAGIVHIEQQAAAMEAFARAVEALSDHELAAFHTLTTGLGSLVLAFALAQNFRNFEQIFTASQLDALDQAERWGEDKEASDVRANLQADLGYAETYLRAAHA